MPTLRWQPCVNHGPDDVQSFVENYFPSKSGHVLLIAGDGFDPRATTVPKYLSAHCGMDGIFIKENRPNPDPELVKRAQTNLEVLKPLVASSKVLNIDVFANDGAVVGGRTLLTHLESSNLETYSDIIVDVSALSSGISFPVVRYLLEYADAEGKNLHLFASDLPSVDHAIVPQLSDRATVIHGFRRVNAFYSDPLKAKLWLPQLAPSGNQALQRIFDEVQPNDTCPILPFSASKPKLSDQLLSQYITEIESTWSVDAGSFIYAYESDPLGLYRSIVRINDERTSAFQALGGSLIIVSPTGSKMLGIGALMAALDRDLPVYYVEARGYEVNWSEIPPQNNATVGIRHVWLCGDAYKPLEHDAVNQLITPTT
jgi:hypothetical protein